MAVNQVVPRMVIHAANNAVKRTLEEALKETMTDVSSRRFKSLNYKLFPQTFMTPIKLST